MKYEYYGYYFEKDLRKKTQPINYLKFTGKGKNFYVGVGVPKSRDVLSATTFLSFFKLSSSRSLPTPI